MLTKKRRGFVAEANRDAKIKVQLGVTYSQARYKLVKLLMFSFADRLGLLNCHVCKVKISNPEEMSIEHKKPWLDVSAELFWDLDNIAFSHLRCNRPHRTPGGGKSQRKTRSEGESWCSKCEDFLLNEMFYANPKGRWNGLSSECKGCHRKTVAKFKLRKKMES